MDVILKVENLVKSYGAIKAVNDISFEVHRGKLFAFLGPNGAGKSTTINVITTLLNADSGRVIFNGKTDEAYFRSKMGVVFQGNVLDDQLTVKENLLFRGALYLNNKKFVKQRYETLADFIYTNLKTKNLEHYLEDKKEGQKSLERYFLIQKFYFLMSLLLV